MAPSCGDLLDDALGEILRREPGYLARFPLAFPAIEGQVAHYLRQPVFCNHSAAAIAQALTDAVAYLAERGASVAEPTQPPDPVAEILFDSVMDGLATDGKAVRSKVWPPAPSIVLAQAYEERRTPAGAHYFVRRNGTRPLVLIHATGVPLGPWSRFLADPAHDFRIIIMESRSTTLLSGGMKDYVDLTDDAEDVAAALDHEGLAQVDVLAWCSGAKPALDLASRHAGRVRSLVLVSPHLYGAKGVAAQPSGFESGLQQLFAAAARRPTLAPHFVKGLEQLTQMAGWERLAADPMGRAAALFSLPAREFATVLLAPMSRPDFLVNYARRFEADAAYPVHEALQSSALPILLVTGDNDNIVNNAFVTAVLGAWAKDVLHASIKGAGHYTYDLQYRYVAALVTEFLEDRRPISGARLSVKPLVEIDRSETRDARANH